MLHFFKRNYAILLIIYTYTLGLFFSATFIPSILIKDHGLSESLISTGSLVLALTIFAASLFTKEVLKFKINYLKIIKLVLSIIVLDLAILLIMMETKSIDQYKYVYLVLRGIEGFTSGVFMMIVSHLLSSKMLFLKNRVEISSVQSTIHYAFKTLGPIAGGLILTLYGSTSPILVTFGCYAIALLLTIMNEKVLLLKYHRYIHKNIVKNDHKFHLKKLKLSGFVPNVKILKSNAFIKFFYVFIFTQNIYRSIYDVFLITVLVTKLSIGYMAAGLIFSVATLGQTAQYFSALLLSYLDKKTKKQMFFLLHILINAPLLMLLSFLIYQLNTDQKIDEVEYVILFGLILSVGLARSLYNSTIEHYNFMIIDIDKKNIADHNGNKNFIADTGNWIGYLMAIALLSISYVVFFYGVIAIIVISLISSAIAKEKNLDII